MDDLIKIKEICRQARLALDNASKVCFYYGDSGLNFNNHVLSQNPYFTTQQHSKYVYRKTCFYIIVGNVLFARSNRSFDGQHPV